MTATYSPLTNLDTFDVCRLLDLSARIASGLQPGDWRTIVEAARPAASDDQRIAALLLLAGPLTGMLDPADDEVLLRAFLPRLSVADRDTVLKSLRDELEQADRFAGMHDAGELADALDVNVVHGDWVRVAEDRTEAFRQSARHLATTAALR